jgi:hypothetical protein
MDSLERMGLPDWLAWFGPVVIVMIASTAWNIYRMKRHFDQRAEVEQERSTIRATGDPAVAIVLETTDTGVRTGADEYFIWRLRLSVHPVSDAPFETTIQVPVAPTRFTDFGEGREIKVKVAPKTREVVVDQRTR